MIPVWQPFRTHLFSLTNWSSEYLQPLPMQSEKGEKQVSATLRITYAREARHDTSQQHKESQTAIHPHKKEICLCQFGILDWEPKCSWLSS